MAYRTLVLTIAVITAALLLQPGVRAQKHTGSDGKLRVAFAKQPFSPNGTSPGPNTMANGGIQDVVRRLGAVVRVDEAALTPDENTEYGG